MKEKYVLIFDIASSTVILEDLNTNNEIEKYQLLIDKYYDFFNSYKSTVNFEVYKFMGDGFILLFEKDIKVDEIIIFMIKLTSFSEALLNDFIKEYISIPKNNIPRIGITLGLDFGQVHFIEKKNEYVGRPINVASRLQGSLKEKEHVYNALLSLKIFSNIKEYIIKKACIERERTFRNLYSNQSIRCFELNLLTFKEIKIENFKNMTNKLLEELRDTNKIKEYKSYYIIKKKPILKKKIKLKMKRKLKPKTKLKKKVMHRK